MKYSLDNKQINLSKANIIGFGKNGNVYRYKNNAIKIFPNGKVPKGLIDSKTCHELCSITTNSILLPRGIVYYNDNIFSGYSLRPSINKNSIRNISNMDKESFIFNVKLLEDDLLILSNKGVLLDGILPENVIISDRLYLTDPSRYSFLGKEYSDGLYDINSYQMHLLLSKLIISSLKKSDVTPKELRELKEILLKKKDKELSSTFFDNLIGEEKNIHNYVKKMRV